MSAESTCWQLEQRFAHMLGAVADLSRAGGQAEVVVCVAAVQLCWLVEALKMVT